MLTLKEIRRKQYEYRKDHDRSTYTWLKARYQIEISSFLVYLLQYTNIHPNAITILYGLLGAVSGVLLTTTNELLISTGLVIAFNKGILDFTDGHLARIKNKTSAFGKDLDSAFGEAVTLFFYIGVFFYLFRSFDYYSGLFVLILFLLKKKFSLSRACITDSIIFLVGIHLFLT